MKSDKSFDTTGQSAGYSHWKTLKTLGSYLWPKDRLDLRFRVVLALLFLILAKVLGVYVPFLLKAAIDALSSGSGALQLAVSVILAYGAARIISAVFGELRDYIFVNVAQSAQRRIALITFQHMHGLSLEFHLSRQTGGLSRVIERGTRGIQTVLRFMTFNIIPTFFEIGLVTVVLLWHFGFSYAAVIFTTIVLYIAATLSVTNWRTRFRKEMNREENDANNRAVDSLLNFETVKYFGNEDFEYDRFDRSQERYESAAIKTQAALSVLNMSQAFIIGAGLTIVMLMAARDVTAGILTVGDFVLVNTFMIQLYLPLNFLGFVYREIKDGLVDMDQMFELLDIHASVSDDPGAPDLEVTQGVVEFNQVSFGYLDDRTILKDVSFTIQPGKTLAVVGSSGAGKSTLSRLLFRFYDVDAGCIKIDGQDIRRVAQKSLRSHIGIVPQDTVLFNDSIGYNIRYGNPASDEEAVKRAARVSSIHDFIERLPLGYDTPVGERGLKISGGEKQRVAIARVILKSPQILLFDEATSSLDSHTEKEIQAALKEVSKNHTTLIIAHRLSTVVDADEIVVLKEGRIVERGTHQELLTLKGEYASLWSKQKQAKQYEARLEEIP